LVVALALAVALAALTGCGGTKRSDETTSNEAVSSATVETTATTSPGDSAATGTGATAPGEIDQADLQAELEAIERELDAMTLPDDADFSDIESALQ